MFLQICTLKSLKELWIILQGSKFAVAWFTIKNEKKKKKKIKSTN